MRPFQTINVHFKRFFALQYYFALQNFPLEAAQIVTKVDHSWLRAQPIGCSAKE